MADLPIYYVEVEGARIDFPADPRLRPALHRALEYFICCAQDESGVAQVRLIDPDGKTVIGVLNWDGVFASHVEVLKAASHALRSYQYGNAAPDLAKGVADSLEALIAGLEV